MGFWKNVALDMQHGVSKETAIKCNAVIRYSNNAEEIAKAEQELQWESKLNNMC